MEATHTRAGGQGCLIIACSSSRCRWCQLGRPAQLAVPGLFQVSWRAAGSRRHSRPPSLLLDVAGVPGFAPLWQALRDRRSVGRLRGPW